MRRALLLAAAILTSIPIAIPAPAILVVFEDGRLLHVSSYETTGERVSLNLDGGGTLTVSLERVERIIDDEWERPGPPEEQGETRPPAISVRTASAPSAVQRVPFAPLILEAARRHHIDPALIAAVIQAESNFRPEAVSRKGARGLMQLMPATARRLGVRRSRDPAENIRGGTAYLSELAERFGAEQPELVLAAYNAGERAVETYGGVPPYRETVTYVQKVIRLWSAAREPARAEVKAEGSGAAD